MKKVSAPRLRRRRNARADGIGIALIAGAMFVSAGSFGTGRAIAFPVTTPSPGPVSTAAPLDTSNHARELPFNSPLVFILDGSISSNGSKAGDRIPVHLKYPIVIGGHTVAAAGTPGIVRILGANSAQIGDIYGYVDIYFEPIVLADGAKLPLRSPTTRLSIRITAGHASTVGIEDNIEDAVIPFHYIYHVFRKGRNFELAPGAQLQARTQAVVAIAPDGAAVISTPAPIAIGIHVPHSSFSASPLATPASMKERGPILEPSMAPGYPTEAPSPS
ncbi:MAG: hypothetical protein ACYDGM_01455 [Vulcanimicrobiaceae bacterium]